MATYDLRNWLKLSADTGRTLVTVRAPSGVVICGVDLKQEPDASALIEQAASTDAQESSGTLIYLATALHPSDPNRTSTFRFPIQGGKPADASGLPEASSITIAGQALGHLVRSVVEKDRIIASMVKTMADSRGEELRDMRVMWSKALRMAGKAGETEVKLAQLAYD